MISQPNISMELSAYLDGQLPPNAARWVDRAATENPDVARQLHDLRRVRTILRSLEPVRLGNDFVARVIAEAKRRGLMRRVVRERMIQGIFRLASAAAAVLLVAVVAGVAVQSFIREPRPTGHPSGPGSDVSVVAATPRPQDAPTEPGPGRTVEGEDLFSKDTHGRAMPSAAKPNGKVGDALQRSLRGALGYTGHDAHTLDLSVANLGAGAKEVEAVLASAGITRSAGGVDTIAKIAGSDTYGLEPAAELPGRTKAAKSATGGTSPKFDIGRPAVFYRAPGDTDELRFVVVAQPDRIAAVTGRLGDLRQIRSFEESSSGLCKGELTRPEAGLPKTVSAPAPAAIAAKPAPKSRPTTEPYHTAELQRLANNSQMDARQTTTGSAAASQATHPVDPGREVLIITVRLRPSETNRADPMRNTKP